MNGLPQGIQRFEGGINASFTLVESSLKVFVDSSIGGSLCLKEQMLFASEVVVQQTLGDTGCLGHRRHRSAAVALSSEEAGCRIENSLN